VDLVCFVLDLAFWVIIAWVILSWVAGVGRLPWDHPVRRVYTAIDKAMQPVLRPLRSALPPVRMGAAALDLSPLILIFGLRIIQWVIC
jgi:YggT family protein